MFAQPFHVYLYALIHLLWIVLPVVCGFWQIQHYQLTDFIDKVDAFLLNFLWIGVGLQGTLAGLSQIFKGEKSATYLKWPYSPFVRELGYANLAFGILGLLCIFIKGDWWAATGVGYSIFLLCAAIGHIYDIFVNKNYSVANMGPTLWADLFIPIGIYVLLVMHYHLG